MKMELTTRRVCADTEAQLISITQEVEEFVAGCGIENGVCFVISAHTTAGITVNEGLPCVETDLLDKLDELAPADASYAHNHFLPSYGTAGGNAPGHLKSMLCGNHCLFPVQNGRLVRSRAQEIYFAEFDGVKARTYYIEVMGE